MTYSGVFLCGAKTKFDGQVHIIFAPANYFLAHKIFWDKINSEFLRPKNFIKIPDE